MFTQPCFIRENTPELRKKLEELEYKICPCAKFDDACWLATFPTTTNDTVHGVGYTSEEEFPGKPTENFLEEFLQESKKSGYIDCGTNEQKFLALAALRDDTDKNQLFCSNYSNRYNKPDDWQLCTEDNYENFFGDCPYVRNYDDYHKATVEEIIEHFKE